MSRTLGLIYGIVCYAIGFGSLAYAIFFLNNIVVARTIDAGNAANVPAAIAINLGLALLFAAQHGIMARSGFKRMLTRFIPASVERSTYVLLTGVALILLYAFWQPLPQVIWSIEAPALRVILFALQACGWVVLVAATFMLSHFELFGLSQVWAHFKGREQEPPRFRMPGLYKVVRHPIQLGVLIAFWMTPDMSLGHLVLSGAITGYVLVSLVFLEEPDLTRQFGEQYREYQKRVGMLIPRFGGSPEAADPSGS